MEKAENVLTFEDEISESQKSKSWKFLIGGLLIIGIAIYLVVSSVSSSGAYYLTVGELEAKARAGALHGRNVRVAGKVIGDTVDWDAESMSLRFSIQDETGTLKVLYRGPKPDNLTDGADAVVEGKLGKDGVFHAKTLLLKCPSRYEDSSELNKQ